MFNKTSTGHSDLAARWFQPYGVFAFSITSGMLSYRLCLHGWCYICYAFKISSNPAFGINYIAASIITPISIVSSSFISSHISIQCYKQYIDQQMCYFNYPNIFNLNYNLLSIYEWNSDFHKFLAISSIVSFSAFRSIQLFKNNVGFNIFDTFRIIAPSDLWSKGSFARYCIKNNVHNGQYANENQKILIEKYGRKYGCHHCGKKEFINSKFKSITKPFRKQLNKINYLSSKISLTQYIADHIPPSKVLKLKKKQQIFLPQCQDCCAKQAISVKTQQRTLVIHNFRKNMRWFHLWIPFPFIFNYFINQNHSY